MQLGLVPLTPEQSHYVLHVLRLQQNAPVFLFNEHEGEWKGHLVYLQKKAASVSLEVCVRIPKPRMPVHIIFAPLKNEAMQFLVEKAAELGVTDFWPVITHHTVNRFNETRAKANALMATQQCERLDLPLFHSSQKLATFLQQWPQIQPLYVAAERNVNALPLLSVLRKTSASEEAAFLIGPEGGFAPQDWQLLEACTFVQRITLGAHILRAETAALMCLSLFQGMQQER